MMRASQEAPSPRRRPSARRRHLTTVVVSIAGHLLVLFALLSTRTAQPRQFEPSPVTTVVMVQPPPPAVEAPHPPEEASPAAAAPPAPVEPPPPVVAKVRPKPAPPDIEPQPASERPTTDASEVSDAQLASAAPAGSGSGTGGGTGSGSGGGCDMTRWLQNALRKDRLVQAAVAEAHHGKAIMVWNGDWVRRLDQDGNGLAAVREAMMWEIAFAPQACRAKPVHGLVQISLSDGPGAARLVVGAGDWRWSDLLRARGGG